MPAKKPIRRAQLISPWGIGQMINFPKDESLMVAGLDLWEEKFRKISELDEFIISEERLAKRLGVIDFRLPPDFRDPGQSVTNPSLQIPFVRFPKWHYCTRCGLMEDISIFSSRKPTCSGHNFNSGRSCSSIASNKRQKLIPVRFIAICPQGHIQDFPFMQWVHGLNPTEGDDHHLRLRAGRSSGMLSGIEISCSCGLRKTMAGAFNDQSLAKIGITCSGGRPWLGEEATRNNTKHCGENLIIVQKGASNVYFPHVRSSIYLPPEKKSIGPNVDSIDDSEEKYRKMEYDAILSATDEENEDFYVTKIITTAYDNSETGKTIGRSFKSIALLHKLKETRAFVGFSRWLPDDGKTLVEKKDFIKLARSINWLPAIVVKGEGVFFEFNHELLREWASKKEVIARAKLLSQNHNHLREEKSLELRKIKPEFVLIHTFAHLVINQFSYECGYGSSALRERIYCNIEFPSDTMNGVLIYTASGDSEGSLGGLVRQGKPGNLETIVYKSIENARWCSSDPICIDSGGQGPNSCNLAACHNCTLLPETCCEESNMLLDRAMLIGTLDVPNIGFFNRL